MALLRGNAVNPFLVYIERESEIFSSNFPALKKLALRQQS
jgi:hypothetical protein